MVWTTGLWTQCLSLLRTRVSNRDCVNRVSPLTARRSFTMGINCSLTCRKIVSCKLGALLLSGSDAYDLVGFSEQRHWKFAANRIGSFVRHLSQELRKRNEHQWNGANRRGLWADDIIQFYTYVYVCFNGVETKKCFVYNFTVRWSGLRAFDLQILNMV